MKLLVISALVCAALTACGGGGGGSSSSLTSAPQAAGAESDDQHESAQGMLVASSTSTLAATTSYLADLNAAAWAAAESVEDFNSYSALDGALVPRWLFTNGPEFAGAAGTMAMASSQSDRHADLVADLGCGTTDVIPAPKSGCGRYVSGTRNFSAPFTVSDPSTARMLMRVRRTQPLLATGMRVRDMSGQMLQFNLPGQTIEGVLGDGWTHVSVPLRAPASYWGGMNNGVLQGGVTGVSLTVGQQSLVGPRGTVQFDDIRVVRSNAVEVGLTGQEPVLSNGVIAKTTDRMATGASFYRISDASMKLASEAGFNVIRLDLFWEQVQRNGRFDFSIYETVLTRLAKYGMKALFILDYGHPDFGGGSPQTEASRAAYVEFARQAARFAMGRNVVAFEVWNEPDNTTFWRDGDPRTYAALLGPTVAAIKSIDPNRKVLNGGPSWVNLPYVLDLARTGQLAGIDGFAIHPYRKGAPETFAGDLASLRYVLKSQGVTAPVWSTEWGYTSGGLNTSTFGDGHDTRARTWQAKMVLRTMLTQMSMNLPMMMTFELLDRGSDPANPEYNYGMLTSTLAPKPAYVAAKQLFTLTGSKNYKGVVTGLPANVHAMKWDGDGKVTYAVWMDSSQSTTRLSIPSGAQVQAWDGSIPETVIGASNTRQLNLTMDSGPIYVTF
ncbi:cellulase family glycosylhydrolase [uncultured Aquabacterium sp.]|uniref:glycoside hydrolase family 5 protein n=1 Tax=Aquabacterium sp. TaxID=1872578 RepID=UPI0025FE4308|nr:cellulase family glycosylhydrolase [uncultured Aquabacterium sp.]